MTFFFELALDDEADDRFDLSALDFDEVRLDFAALTFDEDLFDFDAFARRAALAFAARQLARARLARTLLPLVAFAVQRSVGFGRVQPLC